MLSKQIGKKVYKLYGLTGEEIAIVEGHDLTPKNYATCNWSIQPSLTTHCTLAAYSVRTQNRLKIYAFFTLKTIFGKKFQRLKKEKRLRLIKLQGLINNRGDWT